MTPYADVSIWFGSLSGLEIIAFGTCALFYAFLGLILTHRWIDGLTKEDHYSGSMSEADGCAFVILVIIAYLVGATVWPLTWGLVWLWRFARLIASIGR